MDDALNLLDGLEIDIPGEFLVEGGGSDESSSAEFFGPYQLIQEVGVGGVAEVFRGRHIHPRYAETTFAVKILHDELSHDPEVLQFFRNEAYVLAMLNHPNIVKTFEAGTQDERLFIAMEYIDGRDLDEMLLRCQRGRVRIPVPLALHIVGEVLKGLAYAHELTDADGRRLRLVHRDVNPANVFLSYDGRIKLGDFGVAAIAAGRVEKNRAVAGKVGYFAPEQLEGNKHVDRRADIFATGTMLYEVACGGKLFSGTDTDKIMRLNRRAKIPKPSKANPDIQPALEAVMLKALERRPDDRFQDAREMLAALEPFLPSSSSMSLGMAAFTRKVFLKEHVQELQLREGLAGVGPGRGSGQLIALFSRDERAQLAFNELLLSRGYRMETHVDFESLSESAKSGNPPSMALLDVCSQGFTTSAALAALADSRRNIPVVAVADGLESNWVKAANDIGAVDLLFKPFNVERVLTAVRATITGAARIGGGSDHGQKAAVSRVKPKLLVVTGDHALGSRLSGELAERDYEIDVSPTADEAVERSHHASYTAVLYDAHPPSPAHQLFAGQFRGQAGLGLVPIVYLADESTHTQFAGVDADRSAVRMRDEPAVVLAETINQLRADVRLGRTFVRFAACFPAELRYGGRVFAGEAVDISRGGVMIRCEQMPPVNTSVSVSLRPPSVTPAIEANGRVVRVELPREGEHHLPGVGVEFERFSRRGESQLINFLGTLDHSSLQRTTVILGSTPRRR
jgi:serine/threonine-protein kinase